ncbi:hypothetical protein [Subtercola sp. YIM 133946]|uniref:hypothetical protein n=1 Tax=Subtercola sp. YIM 133946 TaxID=3118909 RepID=UPI002F92A601
MDDQTWQRAEGPTPAGGAYSIAYFSLDDDPVARRYANQLTIVEYSTEGAVIATTLGSISPTEASRSLGSAAPGPSPDWPPEARRAQMLSTGMGRWSVPWARRIADGPPLAVQAGCLARAFVVNDGRAADGSLAVAEAFSDLMGRYDGDQWLVVRDEGAVSYMQLTPSGGRTVFAPPAGVAAASLLELDPAPYRGRAAVRLEMVRDLLAQSDSAMSMQTDLATAVLQNALGSKRLADTLWRDLLATARAFTDDVEGVGGARIPAEATRQALSHLAGSAADARAALMLDATAAASYRLVDRLARGFCSLEGPELVDARQRWFSHQFSRMLARGPQTEESSIHLVVAALTELLAESSDAQWILTIANDELRSADELIEQAVSAADLDAFFWLLFDATVPLMTAELIWRVFARQQSPPPGAARYVNLIEEKRVRVTTSIYNDAEGLYRPIIGDVRNRLREAKAAGGTSAVRRAVAELSEHSLTYPRAFAEKLAESDRDDRSLWLEAHRDRDPLARFRQPADPPN